MVLNLPKIPDIFKHQKEITDELQNKVDYPISKVMDYFSGVAIDATTWTSYVNQSAAISVGSGEVNLSTGATSASIARITGINIHNLDENVTLIFQARVKLAAGTAANCSDCTWGMRSNDTTEFAGFLGINDGSVRCLAVDKDENEQDIDVSIDATTYQNYKLIIERNIITWFINDILVAKIERGTSGYPSMFRRLQPRFSIQNGGAADRDMYATNARITLS